MTKEPEARTAYLALGPSRTLQELHRQYTKTTPETAPSIDTLKRWSAAKKWARLAAAHDEEVVRTTAQRVADQQAKRAADLVTHLIAAAAEGLTRAVVVAAQESRFKDLVEGSVAALKAAEVLSGGMSDRIEQHQRMHLERAEAVRKQLEELLGLSNQPNSSVH
jgi:uncharacterized protein YeaO (DUF488 family)